MDILYCALAVLVATYAAYRITKMIMYALTWGMFLSFIKEYFAQRVSGAKYWKALQKTKDLNFPEAMAVFEGTADEYGLYDEIERDSFWFRVLCCDFCLGFWVSFTFGVAVSIMFNCYVPLFVVPILTNHLIEYSR